MGLWADDKAMRVGPSSCVEVSLIQKTLNKSLVSFTMRVDRGKTATYEPPTLVPFRNLSFAASRTCLKSIFLLDGLNQLRTEFLVINIVNQSHRGSTKCPNGSWNWLNMIRAYHTASPEALKLSPWQRAHERQMGTSECPDAVTGGMTLSRRECPDARAQPKTTFRLCGVLETTHCCQTSGAAWASTSGVPDLCNPESVASWCPQTPGEHRSMCCGCGEVGSRLAGRVGCMVGLLVTPVRVPKFPSSARRELLICYWLFSMQLNGISVSPLGFKGLIFYLMRGSL